MLLDCFRSRTGSQAIARASGGATTRSEKKSVEREYHSSLMAGFYKHKNLFLNNQTG